MVHNDNEPASRDADETARVHDLTRLALEEVLKDLRDGRKLDGHLSASIRDACHAARQLGLQAEKLVVIVKGEWRQLTDARCLERREADATLNEVITACIAEFYRPDGTH